MQTIHTHKHTPPPPCECAIRDSLSLDAPKQNGRVVVFAAVRQCISRINKMPSQNALFHPYMCVPFLSWFSFGARGATSQFPKLNDEQKNTQPLHTAHAPATLTCETTHTRNCACVSRARERESERATWKKPWHYRHDEKEKREAHKMSLSLSHIVCLIGRRAHTTNCFGLVCFSSICTFQQSGWENKKRHTTRWLNRNSSRSLGVVVCLSLSNRIVFHSINHSKKKITLFF